MSIASRALANLRRAISKSARVWVLPNLVLGLFVVALFALLLVLGRHETETRKNELARDIQWAEHTIHTRLSANQDFLQTLANDIAAGAEDLSAFRERTAAYIGAHPELTQIAWIDADQVVRWVAPFETTAWNVGERLSSPEQEIAFQRAQRTGVPAYSMPEVFTDEQPVIEIHVPVLHNRASRGAVVGIYDAGRVLRLLSSSWFWNKYRVVMETEEQLISANSKVGLHTDLTELVNLDPPGQGLRLRVSAYAAESYVARDMLLLLIGGLVALMSWSLWRLMAHMRRRLEAEQERDRLFNLSLDPLCVLNLDASILRANPAFERVLGTSPEALHGTALLDLVHPDDMEVTHAQVHKLARGEPSTGFENRCRCADGSYRWLAWSANPAIEEERLYCVAHDITERKATEDAIRTESSFRRAMEESVITGLRAVDLEGRITFVNPAFCRMVGWTAEELTGATQPYPYWPEEEREALERTTRTWMGGHTPSNGFEIRIRRKNGERFFARMYVSPLLGADGRQTGWMASLVDMTEQKRARAELEASRQRFVAALDGLDAAVRVTDVESGEILFVNDAFKRIYGASGVGLRSLALAEAAVTESIIDPRELSHELPRGLYDGEVRDERDGRWFHLRERAIRWVDGRVVRMQTWTDITDRKRAEELTRQQQERLQQTSRLITMGEMASSLAHELNQPLAAIANYCTGCVNRLQSGSYRPEELLAAMQKASSQAERAGKVIRRLREFVRTREPNRAAVPIGDIVEEALGIVEIEARKVGVDIRLDIPRDLPQVYADKVMIEQVVLNLVKNGIEAMEGMHSDRRRLTVSARADDGRSVELAVADRGTGISPDQAGKLFAAFYTTKKHGMGMGLNICRSIVEFHDGRLWAQPNEGGGSIFTFTLPVER